MSFAGVITAGNSKLTAQPLGVVKIAFKGFDLGKTTEESVLMPESDVKDILYQQDGTKAADHVKTGEDYIVKATFGEINTKLLSLLMYGFDTANLLTSTDHAVGGRQLYQSMRDNFAGPLKVAAVGPNGVPSEEVEDILWGYEAIPIVDGNLINWGADTQRNLTVNFRLKWHRFATGESATYDGAFFYIGDPTEEDVPAVVWPDVAAPEIVTATVVSATSMEIVFNENIAFQTAFAAENFFANVDGDFVAPSAGVIATTTLTLTFPAASFAAGDVIKINISDVALQDTDATPNTYPGISNQAVTNSVP